MLKQTSAYQKTTVKSTGSVCCAEVESACTEYPDKGIKRGQLILYDSFGNISDTLVFKDGVEYNELD